MADIRIRVGAVGDSSLATIFTSLTDAARRARTTVQTETDKLGASIPAGAKKGVDAAEKEFAKLAREAEKWQRQMVRDAEKATADKQKAIEKQQKAAEKAATDQQKTVEKALAAEVKAAEKAEAEKTRLVEAATRNRDRIRERSAAMAGRYAIQQADQRERTRQGSIREQELGFAATNRGVASGIGTAGRVIGRVGSAALGAAERFGGDIVRGYGVNTDVASMFTANNQLESTTTKISNSGYMAGASGANGSRQDPAAIARQIQQVATATAFDQNKAAEGLDAFVAKTGDLETGRAILRDMAVLSRATGTEFQDMVSAAADVSNNLGDVPNKGEAINKVMRVIAGEGKLGAVEIKDLATQMAKVASAAGQIEGDAGDNIALLGAFAQEARQRGGAASATQAATSVQGLINTFKTPARAAAFKAATGQDVFNKQGMLRNPQELLMEALRSSGMDPTGFKKIFSNVSGGRAVEGFATLYRQAGGGAAGEAAVTAEFDRLKKAAMDDAEIMDSFKRSMSTAEAQAQVFNNSLQATAAGLQEQLTPAIVGLAPKFLELASTTASVIEWLVGREAQVKSNVDTSSANVDTDLTNTGKQLSQGYILDAQQKKNAEDEKQARAVMNRAVFESGGTFDKDGTARVGHDAGISTFDRIGAKVGDVINPFSWGRKALTGQGFGEASINKQEATQQGREDVANKAVEKYDEIRKGNDRVADLLRDHIIQVKVTNLPAGATTASSPLPRANPGATLGPEAKVVHE